MKPRRFVIEGTWSGYRSEQGRVVHVSVHGRSCKALRAFVEETPVVSYTDGTGLYLTVRDCKPRERVVERRTYSSLISDCCRYDVWSVSALMEAQKAVKA